MRLKLKVFRVWDGFFFHSFGLWFRDQKWDQATALLKTHQWLFFVLSKILPQSLTSCLKWSMLPFQLHLLLPSPSPAFLWFLECIKFFSTSRSFSLPETLFSLPVICLPQLSDIQLKCHHSRTVFLDHCLWGVRPNLHPCYCLSLHKGFLCVWNNLAWYICCLLF